MRKIVRLHLYLLCTLLFITTACEEKIDKTEYTQGIPHNASEVISVQIQTLLAKSGMSEADQKILFEFICPNTDTAQQLRDILKTSEETGIDWQAPLYLFKAPSLPCPIAAVLKVVDYQKLNKLFEKLSQDELCSSPNSSNGFYRVETPSGISITYNDGMLLVVLAESSSQLPKLQAAITSLMKQSSEKSIRSNPNFALLQQQKGDICVLGTPDDIPFKLRAAFNWPQGTPLLSCLLFENGRVYASLQRADFKGETQESNQPFIPTDSHELQKAINTMRSGYPYNIGFTPDALLTLTNLRTLIEFTPDEPEVQALYQLIMQIESINVRGNGNRANFTLVLQDKNRNSLKQLLSLGKQFIGL